MYEVINFFEALFMGRQAYIKKDIPITEIRKVKRDLQKFVDLYEKVSFIEDLYGGETIKSAMEMRGKSSQTGYNWLKDWNNDGFDGLFRKEGSGRHSKLSDFQFKVLHDNIISKELTSIAEVKQEIKNEFGVSYSERHLRRLIFHLGLENVISTH